ncbi:hypothetical protein EN993_34380, partial [Mesorhizobium sp. M7D.F.Ca.US.004.01.2.1]
MARRLFLALSTMCLLAVGLSGADAQGLLGAPPANAPADAAPGDSGAPPANAPGAGVEPATPPGGWSPAEAAPAAPIQPGS